MTFNLSGGADFPYPAPVLFRAAIEGVRSAKEFTLVAVDHQTGTLRAKTGLNLRTLGERVVVRAVDVAPGRSHLAVASELVGFVGVLLAQSRHRANIDRTIHATSDYLRWYGDAWTAELGGTSVPAESVPPPGVPAGWYPDPSGVPAQRYWDGSVWTHHTAPRP